MKALLNAFAILLILGAVTGCAVQIDGGDGEPDEELAAEGSALHQSRQEFLPSPQLAADRTVLAAAGPDGYFTTNDTRLGGELGDHLLLEAQDEGLDDEPGVGDDEEPDPTPWAQDTVGEEQEDQDQEESGGGEFSSNSDEDGEPDPTPWAGSAAGAPSGSANGNEDDDLVTFSEPDPTPWRRPWWLD